MSRTTTRDIIKITAELAKMDRRGKLEVFEYLNEELKNDIARKMAKSVLGDLMNPEQELKVTNMDNTTSVKVPVTYTEGEA